MIMPFSADSTYQTVKRGMSMIRAIKAGQILYAYTSSTGAVIDATTAADCSASDIRLFGLSAGDADAVDQVSAEAVKAAILADLVLTSGAVTDAAYLAGAEWSCGTIVFVVKSVSEPVAGEGEEEGVFTASMVLEAKVAGTTGNVETDAALTTSAAATNLTSASVASITTPGAASYLATPLRSVDVVVSGAIDGASFKAANGALATSQEKDDLRKIGLFVI